jgi:RNA polymerase sigma-70 factor (ECF subfamily)
MPRNALRPIRRCGQNALKHHCPELSAAETEELAQDVFLVVNRHAQSYIAQIKFTTWLFGITVKTAKGWRRTHWLRVKLLGLHGESRTGMAAERGADSFQRVELRDSLQRGLDRLSTGQREVLFLHAVEGFTGEEIARLLGIRPKTVWTRLNRARAQMIRTMTGEDIPEAQLQESA